VISTLDLASPRVVRFAGDDVLAALGGTDGAQVNLYGAREGGSWETLSSIVLPTTGLGLDATPDGFLVVAGQAITTVFDVRDPRTPRLAAAIRLAMPGPLDVVGVESGSVIANAGGVVVVARDLAGRWGVRQLGDARLVTAGNWEYAADGNCTKGVWLAPQNAATAKKLGWTAAGVSAAVSGGRVLVAFGRDIITWDVTGERARLVSMMTTGDDLQGLSVARQRAYVWGRKTRPVYQVDSAKQQSLGQHDLLLAVRRGRAAARILSEKVQVVHVP
jgi:hypothetical protein